MRKNVSPSQNGSILFVRIVLIASWKIPARIKLSRVKLVRV
jgi:hypothetical protein